MMLPSELLAPSLFSPAPPAKKLLRPALTPSSELLPRRLLEQHEVSVADLPAELLVELVVQLFALSKQAPRAAGVGQQWKEATVAALARLRGSDCVWWSGGALPLSPALTLFVELGSNLDSGRAGDGARQTDGRMHSCATCAEALRSDPSLRSSLSCRALMSRCVCAAQCL